MKERYKIVYQGGEGEIVEKNLLQIYFPFLQRKKHFKF